MSQLLKSSQLFGFILDRSLALIQRERHCV
uniref:Uncharacterized protein n=1 Tax=Arundo donax TaxID=35708 RepID=A0A0A9AMP7_ARUDO